LCYGLRPERALAMVRKKGDATKRKTRLSALESKHNPITPDVISLLKMNFFGIINFMKKRCF
jgi:hypothetical protein